MRPLGPLDFVLRWGMRTIQQVRIVRWRFQRPAITGAHAVPVTNAGTVILVKPRYEREWSVPGGARDPGESALDNALREMREEIGLVGHRTPLFLLEETTTVNYRTDTATVFLVPITHYGPRRSLEIEAIGEFRPDRLPRPLSSRAQRWIDAAMEMMSGRASHP